MSRKEKLLKIITHYGVIHQLKYFFTEIFELTEAVISGDTEHIVEELADVNVMISQFMLYFNVDILRMNEIMEYKINRQIDRINKEET